MDYNIFMDWNHTEIKENNIKLMNNIQCLYTILRVDTIILKWATVPNQAHIVVYANLLMIPT